MVKVSILCVLLICISHQLCTADPIVIAPVALKSAVALYQIIQQIEKLRHNEKMELDHSTIIERQTFQKLDQLSTDFQELKNIMLNKISNELRDKLTEKSDELFKHVKDVQRLYRKFLNFVTHPDKYESTEIRDFAEVATTANLGGLSTKIEKMHEALVDVDIKRESLCSIIAKESTTSDTMCIRHQSRQQLIHELYEAVILTDTKGLLITLYALDVKAKYENKSYDFRRAEEMEGFYNRTQDTFMNVKEAMRISSREVRSCDATKHIKGGTYDKLQEIFQGFFVWEPDTYRSAWATAFFTCASIKNESLRCRSETCKAQPAHRRCTGILRRCESISSSMQLCHSPEGSDRKYDWMITKTNMKYGRYYENCKNTQSLKNIWPVEVCFCNCESDIRQGDRYFSLLEAVSDVNENKVVTGIKLIKDNHIFHIQIQQGTLGENGTITSVPTWKNITNISQLELFSDKVSTYHFVDLRIPGGDNYERRPFKEWVEFHRNNLVYTVTNKQKNVHLDDLVSDSDNLLTGLRFRHVGTSLKLQIQTTPFNYSTGILRIRESSWKSNDNNTLARRKLTLSEPDDPTRSYGSELFSSNNQYASFRMSDLKRDLGQYTVPFLDIQEVTTDPPLPLSGAGIFHKGNKFSGGFLGLKIIHYDLMNHL